MIARFLKLFFFVFWGCFFTVCESYLNEANAGGTDAYVFKLDSSGNLDTSFAGGDGSIGLNVPKWLVLMLPPLRKVFLKLLRSVGGLQVRVIC